MIFWVAVLVGIVFAFIGKQKGFFVMWAALFNVLVAIYLGIMLTPIFVKYITAVTDSSLHRAVCLSVLTIVIFTILQTIASTFFTGTFVVTFPKIFDNIGAGILSFILGYLVCNFIFLALCISQFSEHTFVSKLCGQDSLKSTAVPSIAKACKFVASASMQHENGGIEIINKLLIPPEQDLVPYETDEREETEDAWESDSDG